MEITVLLEPMSDGRFCAKSGEPLVLCEYGASRDEALQKLKAGIAAKLQNGSELISLPVGQHPLLKYAGIFKDDPLVDEWQGIIAENRRKENEELGIE